MTSSSSSHNYSRAWMDKDMYDPATGQITEEYKSGIKQFIDFVSNQPRVIKNGKLLCPCSICSNNKRGSIRGVHKHLFKNGFMPGYTIWFAHGEIDPLVDYGSLQMPEGIATQSDQVDIDYPVGVDDHVGNVDPVNMVDPMVQMVNDAFQQNLPVFGDYGGIQEPNEDSRRFFAMLDAANQPLYEGCREGVSALSTAAELMTFKSNYNWSEECVDVVADFIKRILPEDNHAASSYDEIQKLVAGLGLPFQVIDVCEANCMLYWRETENLMACNFCGHPRYQDTGGRVPVPYKRMWYMPLTARLKRLYQSERTAAAMRWHAEHRREPGVIAHPSDAEAWKHFNSVYHRFADEPRNVYLGLSSDGFNPFGKHGRQYSLWPVIVTPYNLPPALCMRREFLFLSILVPGPSHPKRSLDIFLQPLIHELKMLWEHGAETWDVSLKQNFDMRAVLMWTISDFPAYGMLSGWSTHGKLACPYCQDNTDSFQLKHGRKTCWFDCHRRFLPPDHPYRRSTTLFTKGKQVFDGPPPLVDGRGCLDQLRDFGADRTVECGGNGHEPMDGVGTYHNWHKQSIFWDLPYWKDHLLRHNLDVMHIEKNFFDNIMNTILNVKTKTKDNLNSRLDLTEHCSRRTLEVNARGKAPVPAFRLDGEAKQAFFDWITHGVKFPDGYVSNLRHCVDKGEGKFTGMKSHDCHVVMQRLLPFALEGLLPRHVHTAIAGIASFFRDLCTRSLTEDNIRNLEEKIPGILCNLEKIFPPSFFDVMEHLAVHLPREAALGGPVQYRWMYGNERFLFHLKKMVKNLSRVEGSIVAQTINEETANFAEFYFPSDRHPRRRRRAPRNDDGGVAPDYITYVPPEFAQIGRLKGRRASRRLTPQERAHLHLYILTNCQEVGEYERIFKAFKRFENPFMSEEQIESLKETEFVSWIYTYVNDLMRRGQPVPTWLEELINPPMAVAESYKTYFTRGYKFKIFQPESSKPTINSGISSQSDTTVYYGVLREILQVHFPGILDLRFIAFNCDWYSPTEGYGTRVDEFGVTWVHSGRLLEKYDPFVLASQADQVCYIYPPRVSTRLTNPWMTVTQIHPRGTVQGVPEHDPLQGNSEGGLGDIESSLNVDLVIDFSGYVDAPDPTPEVVLEEFEEPDDSASSDYSLSDSDYDELP